MVNTNEEIKVTGRKYEELSIIYGHAIKTIMGDLENMIEDLNNSSGREVVHSCTSRIKSHDSLEKKCHRKNCNISEITDIAGIKVVVLFEDDIPIVAEMIENMFHVKETQDYLNPPKDNGYRGIHKIITVKTIVSGRNMSAPIEIQIKTVLMDALWSVEHVVRYKKDDYDPDVDQRVLEAANRLENLEQIMIQARDFKTK